jgi:pyruvyl transferase EpsO
MPQSIHFLDNGSIALLETQKAIARHPDFTLLVRDQPSLAFAHIHFDCPVYLCPDMAFGLHSLEAEASPQIPVLALMRDDLERSGDGSSSTALHEHSYVTDWVDADKHPFIDRFVPRLIRTYPWLNRPLMAPLEATFRRQALRHLKRGIDILGQGEVVVTDRLHGHILCSMMGKRHIVLDNSYGKVFNYIDAWPNDGLTVCASDVTEVIAWLQKINLSLPSGASLMAGPDT